MRKVTEKTFKAYARETAKQLNTLEITATTVFTYYGVCFRLYRDDCCVGHITIWYDGYRSGKDETTGKPIELNPLHDTMKDLFNAVYESVNGRLDDNGFKAEEAEKQEGRTITVTLHPEDEDEERTITYTGAKSISIATGKAAERIEAHTDESSIDKDHEYMVIIFNDHSKATFRRSSVVKVQEEGKLPVNEEEEDEPTAEDEQKEIAETVAGVGLELLEEQLTELEKLEEIGRAHV